MTTPTTSPSASPTSASSGPRGRFLWYDLMTPDTAAAARFYQAVTGWSTAPFEFAPGAPPYTMWVNAAGNPMGGTMALPPNEVQAGTRAHWMAYIGTPDVDETYEQALSLGATSCVAPQDIPNVGRFAVLNDPQGALFALFTPNQPGGPEPERPGVGDVSWHELYAADLEPAVRFYQTLFGWKEQQSMDMGPMGRYAIFGLGDKQYGGMMTRMAEQPPVWNLYVRVPNLASALDAVRANGGSVIMGPQEVPGGDLVSICLDPHGAGFGLHQLKADR